jgi:hypothetical protein
MKTQDTPEDTSVVLWRGGTFVVDRHSTSRSRGGGSACQTPSSVPELSAGEQGPNLALDLARPPHTLEYPRRYHSGASFISTVP